MAVYVNFVPREHESRRLSMESGPAELFTEATGYSDVRKFSGRWDAMLEEAERMLTDHAEHERVRVELERMGGEVCELTVTLERFRVASGGGGEAGGGDGGSGAAELGSEADPCFSSSSQLVEVHLLSHPKFAGLTDLERRALKAMIDGMDECALISMPESPTEKRMLRDCISTEAGWKAFERVSKGVTAYLELAMEVTARWKGRNNKYTPGTIVSSPPGGFNVPQGRDFLVSGGGCEKNGKEAWSSASFRMSGPDGWDDYLYGS